METGPIPELNYEVLSFSGGATQIEPAETLDFALLRADQLLYSAKQQGRNRVLSNIEALSSPDKPRILLAEDDLALASVLIKDLSDSYNVTHAANGRIALEKAMSKGPYDLILLDYEMPEKNGVEATQELRQHSSYATTPIIILTASGSDSVVENAFGAGADDYVSKSYRARALLARLARHVVRG